MAPSSDSSPDALDRTVEDGDRPDSAAPSAQPRGGHPRLRRWLRRAAKTGFVTSVLALGLWIAIHRIPSLGPFIADGVRSLVGPKPVAWAENVAYAIQDWINIWRYKDSQPAVFWEPPAPSPPVPTASAVTSADVQPAEPEEQFSLPEFDPPFPDVATPADGVWVPIADPKNDRAPAAMFKTMVHPDKVRSFGVLAVVGIDTEAFDLYLVAGVTEPQSNKLTMKDRPGKIPEEHTDGLFAAFNGGFKATHGAYGMYLGGIEYLPPRDIACTFIKYRDDQYGIGTWSEMKEQKDQMLFYRQTPPCLVEDGEIHSLLHYHEFAKGWGATISGDTVIRRSAIGLDRTRRVMMYGLGEAMTAQAIARGMKAAGCHWVAELDVNYSYPRFLFYEQLEQGKPPVATSAIIPGIKYQKEIYVTQPSPRDFFYLVRKKERKAARETTGESALATNQP